MTKCFQKGAVPLDLVDMMRSGLQTVYFDLTNLIFTTI